MDPPPSARRCIGTGSPRPSGLYTVPSSGLSRPAYFTSLTTPTTVVQGHCVQPPERSRLPTALSFGKKRFAHARSTTTASRSSARASRSSSRRPSRSGRPSTRKYSGVTPTHGVTGCDCPGGVGWSSRSKLLKSTTSSGGRPSANATADTPGSASTRRFSSSQKTTLALSGYCAAGNWIAPVSTLRVSNPRSTRRSSFRLTRSSPATTSSGVAMAN